MNGNESRYLDWGLVVGDWGFGIGIWDLRLGIGDWDLDWE